MSGVNVSCEMSIFLPITSANASRYICATFICFAEFPLIPLLLPGCFHLLACSFFVFFYSMELDYCCRGFFFINWVLLCNYFHKFTQDCRGFFCQPTRTVLAKPATQPRRGEREAGARKEPAFFGEGLPEQKMQATDEP